MRNVLVTIFIGLLFLFVVYVHTVHTESSGTEASTYYIHNFIEDTGARNAVAAIYLNYRMYDTVFEALILLVSIIAMLHFFRAGGHS